VFFFYRAELPEGLIFRIIEADGAAGNYGESRISLAQLENTDPDLLQAKIIAPALGQCSSITVDAILPDGSTLFQLHFTLKETTRPASGQVNTRPNAAPTITPEPQLSWPSTNPLFTPRP